MNLTVCVDAVYKDKDFITSVKEIAEAGYKAIEMWFPAMKDLAALKEVQEQYGIKTAFIMPGFAPMAMADKQNMFVEMVQQNLELGKQIDCPNLYVCAGPETADPLEKQKEVIGLAIEAALPYIEAANGNLVLEPLNTKVDHPGSALYLTSQAIDIVKKIGNPRIKVLYDIYHMQIMEGNIIATATENLDWIGHIHCAGTPGRHEIYKGEIDYPYVLKAIEAAGYNGYFGMEYFSTDNQKEALTKTLQMLG